MEINIIVIYMALYSFKIKIKFTNFSSFKFVKIAGKKLIFIEFYKNIIITTNARNMLIFKIFDYCQFKKKSNYNIKNKNERL